MKKAIAFIIVLVMAVSLFASISVNAADTFTYAHIVASGNDPYATFTFHDGKSIDPDTCKWAAIKYRTITEKDNTGVQLKGQLYVNPAAEPFIPVTYKHTQKWETAVIDLTAVSAKTSLSSIWDSKHYTGKTAIRFDPMEPDRDAEDQNNEHNTAEVLADSAIDIAWIAFFDSEAKAKAYDGTQDTPVCLLDAECFTKGAGANAFKSVEVLTETASSGDNNPGTADAAVVAIAAVACIALAGVVVSRKVK